MFRVYELLLNTTSTIETPLMHSGINKPSQLEVWCVFPPPSLFLRYFLRPSVRAKETSQHVKRVSRIYEEKKEKNEFSLFFISRNCALGGVTTLPYISLKSSAMRVLLRHVKHSQGHGYGAEIIEIKMCEIRDGLMDRCP